MGDHRVELAPLVTISADDLFKQETQWQFVVQHALAGRAVLSRCTDPKVGGVFWEIETSFLGSQVRAYDSCVRADGSIGWIRSLEEALAYVSLLGMRWAANAPEGEMLVTIREMMRR